MQRLLRIISPLVFCKVISTRFVFYSISFLSLSLYFYTACYVFLLSRMYPVRPLVAYYPRYRSRACLLECVRATPLHMHDRLACFLGDLLVSRIFSTYLILDFLFYNTTFTAHYLLSL